MEPKENELVADGAGTAAADDWPKAKMPLEAGATAGAEVVVTAAVADVVAVEPKVKREVAAAGAAPNVALVVEADEAPNAGAAPNIEGALTSAPLDGAPKSETVLVAGVAAGPPKAAGVTPVVEGAPKMGAAALVVVEGAPNIGAGLLTTAPKAGALTVDEVEPNTAGVLDTTRTAEPKTGAATDAAGVAPKAGTDVVTGSEPKRGSAGGAAGGFAGCPKVKEEAVVTAGEGALNKEGAAVDGAPNVKVDGAAAGCSKVVFFNAGCSAAGATSLTGNAGGFTDSAGVTSGFLPKMSITLPIFNSAAGLKPDDTLSSFGAGAGAAGAPKLKIGAGLGVSTAAGAAIDVNFNTGAASSSAFLASVVASPNLNPPLSTWSLEAPRVDPNLKPPAAAADSAGARVVSGAGLSAAPNLNPAAGASSFLAESVARTAPNLNPELESLAGVESDFGATSTDGVAPNLNPELGSGAAESFLGAESAARAPNLKPAVVAATAGVALDAGTPNLNAEISAGAATLAPGLGVSHDLHRLSQLALRTMQTWHSHWSVLILNLSPKPASDGALATATSGALAGSAGAAPGFGVSQAAQIVLSLALLTQQTVHVHEPETGLNLSPKPDDSGCLT